ncbi:MAG: hypothetical protein DRP88_06470 [Candidatus Neomarinimicrobiota bacterium]|nr:MAG: hypothetical protein DRP88_06470 [Candidatus Neomarinimicrobiota bacterium]
MKLYNFYLSLFIRGDYRDLNERRKKYIIVDLESIEYNEVWMIKSDFTMFLYLVDELGFIDIGYDPLFREYEVDEIVDEALAIYIASATLANKAVKDPRFTEKYIDSMIRVIPDGIGVERMEEILRSTKAKVTWVEYYEAMRLEKYTDYSPDLYEVIAVLPENSDLLHRKHISDEKKVKEIFNELKRTGRYIEEEKVVV